MLKFRLGNSRFRGIGLGIAVLCLFVGLTARALDTKDEQKVALETILAELKTHYGMIKFKAESFGVSYDALRAKYTRLIDNATTLEEDAGLKPATPRAMLSAEEFRQLMIGLGAEFRDGHTNILRGDDEAWTLGIRTAAIDGHLYVTGFRDDLFDASASSPRVQVGDEILEVGGAPVGQLGRENMLYMQAATFTSRYHRALEMTMNTSHRWLRAKETGSPVKVKFKRGEGDKAQVFTGSFHWTSMRDLEELRTFTRYLSPEPPKRKKAPYAFGEMGSTETYFSEGLKKLQLPAGSVIDLGALLNARIEEAKRKKEAKEEFDPKLAELTPCTRLAVYLVRHEGKLIGVLRIPDYSPPSLVEELKWLDAVIPELEGSTDALIIDQLSNGGGYIYHFARFLSHFANNGPLKLGTMDMRLSETLLRNYRNPGDPDQDTTKRIYGDRPSFVDLALHKKVLEELYRKLKSGERWSGPLSFYSGGSDLYPGEMGEAVGTKDSLYTKPVLVLNDQRSGSGGDFMPSVMQANKRGVIFGETSMGLGGPVYRSQDSLPGSEMFLRCTMGFCLRADGIPIENIGVVPDIERRVTHKDLAEGFVSYAKDALGAALRLAKGETVSPDAPAPSTISSPALHKLQKLASDLKTDVADESDTEKLAARYRKFFADAAALWPEMNSISESEWHHLDFPLPQSLARADVILSSLSRRDEVMDRLADLKKLPRFEALRPLIDALYTGLGSLGGVHVSRCIRLLAEGK